MATDVKQIGNKLSILFVGGHPRTEVTSGHRGELRPRLLGDLIGV